MVGTIYKTLRQAEDRRLELVTLGYYEAYELFIEELPGGYRVMTRNIFDGTMVEA